MTNSKCFGFIGGGQMAQALATGALGANVFAEEQLHFAEPAAAQKQALKVQFPGATLHEESSGLLAGCDVIVLAVKPQVLKQIAADLSGQLTEQHLVISIAAGISLSYLVDALGTERVVRVMPNTPAMVSAAASAYAALPALSTADTQTVEDLLTAIGICRRVPDEMLHAVTAVAGSSPAYAYMMIEALSDGAVAMGMPRDAATQFAAQSLMGAAKMVLETGRHPGELKDQVTSPAGTTIAAVRQLEAAGLRTALIEAVVAAAQRSQELG